MTRRPALALQFRVLAKLKGQPPAGVIVPSVASGCAPKFITQEPAPGMASVHLPAGLVGGAMPLGPGLVCVLRIVARSMPQHPASSAVDMRTGSVMSRRAMLGETIRSSYG